jgi:hypothetical protein
VPLALWASGCSEEPQPCFRLRLNEPLQVRVVSEYSEAAGYDFDLDSRPAPCPPALKLAVPSTLQLAVVAHEERNNHTCLPNTADVLSGSGLVLGPRAPWVTFGTEDEAEIVHPRTTWRFKVAADSGRSRWRLAPRTDRGSAACSQLITDGLVCYEYYVVELSRP